MPPLSDRVRGDAAERELRMGIGRRVRQRRSELGLTMQRLGARVGCSQSMLSKVECGVLMPSLPMLLSITRALGEPVAPYVDGFDPVDPPGGSPHRRRSDVGSGAPSSAA